MIARLLISLDINKIKEEINKTLALHLEGVTLNHPDVLYFEAGEKLGIAEARKIKAHFALKPYSAKGRAVVIEDAGVLTPEAQNALLKTLEEPPKEAVLILGTSSDAYLLPTVLSRCQVINIPNPAGSTHATRGVDISKEVEKLLKSSIEERFKYIEKLKEKELFLHYLAFYFRDKLIHSSCDKEFLKRILRSEEWAKQNVNIRAILEYLMLVMPIEI